MSKSIKKGRHFTKIKNSKGQVCQIEYKWGDNWLKVDICQTNYSISKKQPKPVYGINWSANGTVGTYQTEVYIELMKEAIKECKKLNK